MTNVAQEEEEGEGTAVTSSRLPSLVVTGRSFLLLVVDAPLARLQTLFSPPSSSSSNLPFSFLSHSRLDSIIERERRIEQLPDVAPGDIDISLH